MGATREGIKEVATDAQATVLRQLADKSAQIVAACDSIDWTLARVRENIDRGFSVNSLGELQGQGPSFDRLCGERQMLAEMAVVVGCEAEDIKVASTGKGPWFVCRVEDARRDAEAEAAS